MRCHHTSTTPDNSLNQRVLGSSPSAPTIEIEARRAQFSLLDLLLLVHIARARGRVCGNLYAVLSSFYSGYRSKGCSKGSGLWAVLIDEQSWSWKPRSLCLKNLSVCVDPRNP